MKQQWYKSNVTKTVLIALEHVFAMVMAVSFLWVLSYPAIRDEIFEGKPAKKYEDSRSFEKQMNNNAYQVVFGVGKKDLFETDGKYNPDKIVDIQEYYDDGTISGKDSSGLCYRLGDLLDWGEENEKGVQESETNNIIVCKRADGTFHYYTDSEIRELIHSGTLQFVMADHDGMTASDILSELTDGTYNHESGYTEFKGLQNAEGKMEYIDCWSFDGFNMDEKKKPIEADRVLDIVNDNSYWNGRLNDAYNMISDAVYDISDIYQQYQSVNETLTEGDTNFHYIYANTKTGQVYTNQKKYEDYELLDQNLDEIKELGKYVVVYPKLADFETNIEGTEASAWRDEIKYNGRNGSDFIFAAGIDTTYPIQDSFYIEDQLYSKYGAGAHQVAGIGIAAAILFIIGMIWLTVVAGHNNRDEELHLCRFDHWKTEIAAAFIFLMWLLPVLLVFYTGSLVSMTPNVYYNGDDMYYYYTQSTYVEDAIPYIIIGAVLAAYTCAMFLVGLLSLVRRIKARTLWKDSLLRSLYHFVRNLLENMHCIWKTILFFGAFVLMHWFAYLTYPGTFLLLLVLATELAAFVYLVYDTIGRDKIKKGIRKISGGEVEYKIPIHGFTREQKVIAEDINSIGEGLDAALAKSMKSERLKTDLITNVSHDIKTPLTSIINYVNLLKQEQFEDPKIQHYIEVLEQKAQRLKTLTEDVVEASKVSSGNISLEFMNINLVEMIQQTSGEFVEKFAARNLKEVLNVPEEEAFIRVDGLRTWRILENIYNNAAKYAMEGSRIYADLRVTERSVIFSLKNVSEQPLNISADELTERFIRGDLSRSTEGSGLGLSIAKTLTQMQGGNFELYLDGDLFKVTITFPKVDKNK